MRAVFALRGFAALRALPRGSALRLRQLGGIASWLCLLVLSSDAIEAAAMPRCRRAGYAATPAQPHCRSTLQCPQCCKARIATRPAFANVVQRGRGCGLGSYLLSGANAYGYAEYVDMFVW
jgi:hypothetical protein